MEQESDPLINQLVGSYRIERLIGIGGMGRVYLGVHQTLGRTVAIKLLPPAFVENVGYIQRFVREAQIAAQLNHPNLIACYDFGESEFGYYFVMEYVEGESLADWLIAHYRMKVEDVIPIMRQVCVGLGYAHAAGIIHRDIKPDNILITKEGGVKVADLGLAKAEDKSDSGLTQLGMAIGTPNYISPEQVRGEIDVDWRSDIYSLGATMFHLVTGKIPYDGTSPTMIMTRHVNDPVPIARQVYPEVNEAFSNLLVRMMQKDACMRVANCEEVLTQLDKILPRPEAAQAAAPAVETPAQVAAPAASSDRQEKEGLLWLKFGAFVLAAAVVGGGYLIYKSRQDQHPDVIVTPRSTPPSKPRAQPTEPEKPAVAPEPPAAEKPKPAPEPPPAEKQIQPPALVPGDIMEKILPPPALPQTQRPPQTIGVRDPALLKSADFMGAEAEAVTMSQKDRMILTSQQNVFFQPDYLGLTTQLEGHLGQAIDYKQIKVKFFVMKCTPVEATLAVRVHQLTADPKAGFQYNRTPLCELALKPTEHGYYADFDVTEEFKRSREGGENHGLVLMTSQGGDAIIPSSAFADQKLWPAIEVTFSPKQ